MAILELRGKYNTAKVFTHNVESAAIAQIIELCNQEFVSGSSIRVMPDVHAGAGCTIGTTMTIRDKVVPNMVGVDIGCGMNVSLFTREIDYVKLDRVIRECIPSGKEVRDSRHQNCDFTREDKLNCAKFVDLNRARYSVGTLGGGNHFIEVNKDDAGMFYLVVHSGSRYLGKQVAEYYQGLGYSRLVGSDKRLVVEQLKKEGREKEIESTLKSMSKMKTSKELAFVVGDDFEAYLEDMRIVQQYAHFNRYTIAAIITDKMNLDVVDNFSTIHNYIDVEAKILRKGAISAKQGEMCIIPMNMRDGSLICSGKGNAEWNFSAPHGAGRLMSRSQAKRNLTLEEYQKSMVGISSTSVTQSTLDESPMAYKPMGEILENIGDTVKVLKRIIPTYNFKAGE